MKTILFITALMMGFTPPVQNQSIEEDCDCPPPSLSKRATMCRQIGGRLILDEEDMIETIDGEVAYVHQYEKTLWEISCADPKKDTYEEAKAKIQCMWNKYKELLACDVLGFDISNGNMLKYAIATSFPDPLLDTPKTYGLDINFKDPVDGLTVMDYILKKLKGYQQNPSAYPSQINELTRVYEILRSRGAKHAYEL